MSAAPRGPAPPAGRTAATGGPSVVHGRFVAVALAATLAIPGHGLAAQAADPDHAAIFPETESILSGPSIVLSLEEAIDLATEGSPSFRATRNDAVPAEWGVRAAYGDLLPSASASTGVSWQGSGEQRFGSLTAEQLGFADQPSFLFSSYNIGLSYSVNGQTLFAPGEARASLAATEARIDEAHDQLILRITQSYLEVLRQEEAVRLAGAQLERARLNLRLAEARQEVGEVSGIDTRRAAVEVGRADVALLQAHTALTTAKLRLLQGMGTGLDRDLDLTTTFELETPTWGVDDLTALALDASPGLRSLVASRDAAEQGVKIARSAYFPTFSASTGWSGFTREASNTAADEARLRASVESAREECLFQNDLFSRLADPLPPRDCSRFVLDEEDIEAIRARNDAFPFDFTRQPPSLSFSLSLPLFQGLSRQRNLEAARVQRDDAYHQVRERELALRADVAANLAQVRSAYQTALIEERNQVLADEQLRLAREQYQLGLIPFVDLAEAETVKSQADRDYLNAVFAYHDAVAALEAVVGASLR